MESVLLDKSETKKKSKSTNEPTTGAAERSSTSSFELAEFPERFVSSSWPPPRVETTLGKRPGWVLNGGGFVVKGTFKGEEIWWEL